jgi:hypothetical protein
MALEHRRAASLTVVFSVIAVLLAVPGLHGQTSSSSRPLSATVVGSYVVRNGELTLIVLWRGSPGWFLRGGSGGGSSGGGGNSSAGREVGSLWFTQGGKSFSIDFDYTAGGARLLEQAIRLSETNVVLVDDVDRVSGARIVGRQWVDPKLPERPALDPSASVADQSLAMMASDPILVAIRRDPGLGAYLQCDVPVPVPDGLDASVPDPAARSRLVEYMQQTLAMICWQAVGP